MSISQPSARLSPLQSAKPLVQTPDSQPPATQLAAMLAVEQGVAHPPQCAASVSRLDSQPSTCLSLLQSAKFVLQALVQRPPLQVALLTLLAEQTLLQLPQLLRSLSTSVSHPSATPPVQLAKPAAHVEMVHEPPLQPTVPTLASVVQLTVLPQVVPQVVVAAKLVSQPSAEPPEQSP